MSSEADRSVWFGPARSSAITLISISAVIGGLAIVYDVGTLANASLGRQTFVGIAIVSAFAALAVGYTVFALSIRVRVTESQLIYRSVFGPTVVAWAEIESLSRFSGRGALFLKVRAKGQNITISTYTFSAGDLDMIAQLIRSHVSQHRDV